MSLNLNNSELGKKSAYETQYNPLLLFAIPRAIKRSEIGINPDNPGFYGEDIWTHYEISWLNTKGKPMVAIGEIFYSSSSKNIIESKSMKLYFNSFNNTRLSSAQELIDIVINDLSVKVASEVRFELIDINQPINKFGLCSALSLDNLDIECNEYQPNPDYLVCDSKVVSELLYSNLLKSNCLVTNQPDWGTVYIEYTGLKIDPQGLLKYIVSLRNHNEFHEQCVERIFHDIQQYCFPQELTVYARYTRRGGLDINPYRTTRKNYKVSNCRLIRQ